jgi:diguanylate cyclase (GGDEF)-like protein
MAVVVVVSVIAAIGVAGAVLGVLRIGPLSQEAAVLRRRASLPRRAGQIAGADNLGRILDTMVDSMQRPGLRGGAILLINERNELYFGAHRGLADEQVRDLRLPVGQGVIGTVAAEARPMVVDDLDNPGPGVMLTNRSVGSNALTRSMVAVPVLVHGSVIGVLEMGCSQPHAFDALDVAILEKVAVAVAGGIAQANPLKLADEVLRRRVSELTTLQEAAEALNASLGLDVVLQAVADHAARVVRAPYAAVLLVEDNHAHNAAVHGVDPGVDTAGVAAAAAIALGEGLQHGTTHVAALPAPPGVDLPVSDPLAPLRSVAMARIAAGAGLDAVLCVASPDPRGFDPAQMRLLDGITHLANLTVANAVRYHHLAEAADTDPLTGLLRRSRFEQLLAETRGQALSVLAIDVDHLRDVNDAGGHEEGDRLLRAIAATLRDRLGDAGRLARTSGDEFAVLLPGFEAGTAVAVAEELRRSVHGAPVKEWLPRVSIGLGSSAAGADPRSAWDAAQEALALAKRWGRDRVETRIAVATPGEPRHAWAELVPHLFEEGRIEAVYQPIVRLADRQLAGYEALARPAGFSALTEVEGLFAAARDAGLYRDLDWACRRAAVRRARELPAGVPLFINVGVWALIDPLHDVDQMLLLLRWTGIDPGDVVLELSEREAVHDLDRLREVLAAYRSYGFRFSIDDVGEGHSTLDMLAAGAPDYIKIARSLVAAADHAGARAAINAVVAFARSSSAVVVAEGVQTRDEAERMEAAGVSHGQGYWLGPPLRIGAAVPVDAGDDDLPTGAVPGVPIPTSLVG